MPTREPQCARGIGIRPGCIIIGVVGILLGSVSLIMTIQEVIRFESDAFMITVNVLDAIICISAIVVSLLMLIGVCRNRPHLLPIYWYTVICVIVLGLVQILLTVLSSQEYYILQLIVEQSFEMGK